MSGGAQAWVWWHLLTGIGYVVLASLASGHALLRKRDPRAAFGWIGVCWLMPYAGAALYALFGINRVETRGRRLHGLSVKRPQQLPPHDDELPLTQLQRLGGAVSGMPLLGGNTVHPLQDGEAAYPAMLQAIDAARESVWLASYIFDTTGWCQRFMDALSAAHARGVQVRVLVDGFGELYSRRRAVTRLRRAGVPAARFLPPRLLPPSLSLNLRNHRKLLIVDGEIGFTGGMNIGNRHLMGRRGRRAHDLHFRLRGPVVVQLAAAFQRDWSFATGEQLPLAPPPEPAGEARCRVISDGPDEDIDKLVLVLLSAVSAAHRSIRIMTPYFLPPRELGAALQAAALRGVEVEVMLPARSNLRFVDWATRHALTERQFRGIKLWLAPPPFSHCKLLVVDGIYAMIGSANLDPRSLRLNFELGVEVYDAALCAQLDALFEQHRQGCQRLEVASLEQRSLLIRLRDAVFWLFSPYL